MAKLLRGKGAIVHKLLMKASIRSSGVVELGESAAAAATKKPLHSKQGTAGGKE